MTAALLIAELRSRGVTLVPDGDKLRCRPKSAMTEQDLATLRAHKSEVLALLRAHATWHQGRLVCFTCREQRFWLSIHGVIVCAVCHPPAAAGLVKAWVPNQESREPDRE